MRKVLLVSYNFPPVGGAGVQRPVKFVKYLRDYGWEPIVLTVSNPSVPIIDNSLTKDIPDGATVYRARTFEPSYTQKQEFVVPSNSLTFRIKSLVKKIVIPFILPDIQVLWWPDLILKLIWVIRRERPNVLFVSAPPFSTFLPVVFIGKIMRVPVILDYRDEWAFSRAQWENAIKHSLAKWFDTVFERYAVQQCTAFTVANASYARSICATYQNISPGKGVVITNGFDEDDLNFKETIGTLQDDDTLISLVYTGTVWRATSLNNFVAALKRLLERDPSLRDVLRVKVFGRIVDSEQEYLQDPELTGVLRLFGYVEHGELIAETMAADVLLLTLSDLPGAEKIITGKAFEYMAAGKHILGIVPEGETKNLLTANYNKLSMVDANDINGICSALADIVSNIKTIRMTVGSDISSFSRKELTRDLARVFNKVVGDCA